MDEPTAQPAPRPRGYYRWPAIIFALIGVQLLMGAITIYFATNDSSFAVVPDAYAKAVAWDDSAAANRASQALGWSHELRIGSPDTVGDRYVFVTLKDAEGRPLEGAAVRGEAFHLARAADRRPLEFRVVSPGLYRAAGELRRDGRWVVQLTATRGDDVYRIDTQTHIGSWRPGGVK